MKKQCLIALLFLASCAGPTHSPNLAEQPSNPDRFKVDLADCEKWAEPTRHEWAMRCEKNGDMVLVAHIIDSFDHNDPRDNDAVRQNMPNSTQYRLNMCLRAKGYKIEVPGNKAVITTAER